MKKATFTADGTITAFYHPGGDCPIPAGAVEISDEVWADYLRNQGKYVIVDGEAAVNPAWSETLPLDTLRGYAVAAIDAAAERARLRYITPGSGQAMTYLMKAGQARAFKDGGYVAPVPPLVQATATGCGVTPQVAADMILERQAAWEMVGAAIEQERETGKEAVSASASAVSVETAQAAAVATLEEI